MAPSKGDFCHEDVEGASYSRTTEKGKSTETRSVIASLKGLTWDTVTGPRTMRAEDNQAVKDVELVFIEPANTEKGYGVAQYIKVDGKSAILPPAPPNPPKPATNPRVQNKPTNPRPRIKIKDFTPAPRKGKLCPPSAV